MKSLNCVLTTNTEACAHSALVSCWEPRGLLCPHHTCPHHHPLAPLWVPSSSPALCTQTRSPLRASGRGRGRGTEAVSWSPGSDQAWAWEADQFPQGWEGGRGGAGPIPATGPGCECLESDPLGQDPRLWVSLPWHRGCPAGSLPHSIV